MATIPLTQGQHTIVDDDNLAALQALSLTWFAARTLALAKEARLKAELDRGFHDIPEFSHDPHE